MNFIDYVTLMLINMTGGLTVLAFYLWSDAARSESGPKWVPAMAVPGAVASICGFAMVFTWPLPAPYNIAYGETSILLGMLLLGASWALAKGWSLLPLGIYAFFAGLVGILLGVRLWHAGLTTAPAMSAIGFILTGSGGIFAGLVLRLRTFTLLRRLGSLVLLAAAAIWLYTALTAYWMHLKPAI
ncbi:MAG: DUF981 domain-containing protein [Planctomycetaceae bacterium]|nr:DUF981 domain-containing protein [Planctomycetaceae bacterium]